jgi:dihydroorotate dehydrogenase
MPDWFYRTVSQRVLMRLPVPRGRNLAVGMLGFVARLPGGGWLIDMLGHQRPDPALQFDLWGRKLCSPLGFGAIVDGQAAALPAWTRFGFGYIEVGPVNLTAQPGSDFLAQDPAREMLILPRVQRGMTVAQVIAKGDEIDTAATLLLIRVQVDQELGARVEDLRQLIAGRAANTLGFAVQGLGDVARSHPQQLNEVLQLLQKELNAPDQAVPWVLVLDELDRPEQDERLVELAQQCGCRGLMLEGKIASGTTEDSKPEKITAEESKAEEFQKMELGRASIEPTLAAVRYWHARVGERLTLIASGGIHSPREAVALHKAGAQLLQLDTGLIWTGPTLGKRINQALLDSRPSVAATTLPVANERITRQAWFWLLLLGLGMLFGSLIALGIATTAVVLPYDEQFVGLSAAQIDALNPRLLHFLTHDRVTLAGVMVAVGVLYASYAWFGVRRGKHWAEVTILSSSIVGGCSFFLFLGHGYLEPFHAFVTAIMTQFLLLAMIVDQAPRQREAIGWDNDWTWRWNLWGQLLAIIHGALLMLAGALMCYIGSTSVFVSEDLSYMQTTAAELAAANSKLIPLIAHDRATLGGMLLSAGLAFLLPALWANTYRARWFWVTTTIAGLAGYVPALLVHYHVGYTDYWHLIPAYLGLNYFLVQQALSWPYQWGPGKAQWH